LQCPAAAARIVAESHFGNNDAVAWSGIHALMDCLGSTRCFTARSTRGIYLAPALYEAGLASLTRTDDDMAHTVASAPAVFHLLLLI